MRNHFEFFEGLDKFLAEETIVLDALKLARDKGWVTQEEMDVQALEVHESMTGVDLDVVVAEKFL